MKVIDGGFGQQEENRKPMEVLRDHIDKAGLDELERGQFILLMDTGDAMVMLSNMTEPCEALMIIEKSRMAIMMSEFAAEAGEDPTAS